MKKVAIFLLSLLMVLSLVACGSQGEAVGQIGESNATAEPTKAPTTPNVEEPVQTEEDTVPVETEIPAKPENEPPAFDTSWASNAFEMLLPKPPFDDWIGEEKTPYVYELRRKNSADWEDYAAWDEQCEIFYDYVNGLAEYGFIVEEKIGRTCTQVFVYNTAGDRFTFTDYSSDFEIDINTVSPKSQVEAVEPTEPVKKEHIVDLPDADWVCTEGEAPNGSKYFEYSTKKIAQDAIEDYVDKLKSAGYALHENESEGYKMYWSFINPETDGSTTIHYNTKSGRCVIYIDDNF